MKMRDSKNVDCLLDCIVFNDLHEFLCWVRWTHIDQILDWPNGFWSTWTYLFKHTKCTPFVKPRGFNQSKIWSIRYLPLSIVKHYILFLRSAGLLKDNIPRDTTNASGRSDTRSFRWCNWALQAVHPLRFRQTDLCRIWSCAQILLHPTDCCQVGGYASRITLW